MINACIDRDEPFGLVLLHTGAQQESEETIHRVGVTARVTQVERLEAGRLNILSQGEERFRIYRFIQREPYWKAAVDFIEDEANHHSVVSLHAQVSELYSRVTQLSAELGISEETEPALPETPTELSFVISYLLDIEPDEKQKLLEMTSTAERLRVLVAYLTDMIPKMEQQITYKKMIIKVRGNGDLGKPGQER
jgi:Lon protease-like protein